MLKKEKKPYSKHKGLPTRRVALTSIVFLYRKHFHRSSAIHHHHYSRLFQTVVHRTIEANGHAKTTELENVAIANALQREAARATAFSRFNYDAMPSLTSLKLSIAVL